MRRRILGAVVLAASLAGYVIPMAWLAPAMPAHVAVHCQAEYGHSHGQPNHRERICQP